MRRLHHLLKPVDRVSEQCKLQPLRIAQHSLGELKCLLVCCAVALHYARSTPGIRAFWGKGANDRVGGRAIGMLCSTDQDASVLIQPVIAQGSAIPQGVFHAEPYRIRWSRVALAQLLISIRAHDAQDLRGGDNRQLRAWGASQKQGGSSVTQR